MLGGLKVGTKPAAPAYARAEQAVLSYFVTEAILNWAGNEVRCPDRSSTATVAVVHQNNSQGLDTDWRWRTVSSYTELDDLYVEVTTAVSSADTQCVRTYWYVGSSYSVVACTVVLYRYTDAQGSSVVSVEAISFKVVNVKFNTYYSVRTFVNGSELKSLPLCGNLRQNQRNIRQSQ